MARIGACSGARIDFRCCVLLRQAEIDEVAGVHDQVGLRIERQQFAPRRRASIAAVSTRSVGELARQLEMRVGDLGDQHRQPLASLDRHQAARIDVEADRFAVLEVAPRAGLDHQRLGLADLNEQPRAVAEEERGGHACR